jgi:hypothetical protein
MKTYLILSLIGILSISCYVKKINGTNDFNLYKVNKIDSINNYYILYVKRNDSLFKVVSKKQINTNCKSVHIHKSYDFKLNLMKLSINGNNVSVPNNLDIQCFQFDEKTTICNEPNVYGLYFTESLNGLCLIVSNK